MKKKSLSVKKLIHKSFFNNLKNNKINKIFKEFNNYLNSNLKDKKKTKIRIGVALSGGPDSLALTALAKAYSYQYKCKIYYVLVDHNIRKNSLDEAKSVKRLLKKYHITLHVLRSKKIIRNNIQSKARTVRYNLITNFCKKKKIKTILTAHNFEDQVETFLIRLSRGSGLQGLSSMKQIHKIDHNISLIRPLLDFKKKKLISISKIIFGKYFKDPTNKNTKYLRTRIRNLKTPLETSGINYDKIFQSIKNLASSRDTLNYYFGEIYKDIIIKKKDKVFINLKKFNNINQEMKMLVLKKTIKDFTNSYYTTRSKKITNLMNQIKAKKNAKFTLGGCIIFSEKKHIILEKENKK